MLYDPKWEVQTKADPLSLDSLIAWLEKQPAGKTYCYADSGHCLLSQYFSFAYGARSSVSPSWFALKINGEWGPDQELPHKWDRIADGSPRNFGAALDRARALRASR